MSSAWLSSVPYGGYSADPYASAYGGYGPGPLYPPSPGDVYSGRRVGGVPFVPVTVALTLLGLGLFGGVGAAIGWFGWHTKTAMLVGAIGGLAAPPLASALLSGGEEGAP